MDKSLYIAMSGAERALAAQARISHNLANASTTGFKAVLEQAQAAPIEGGGLPSRANTQSLGAGFDARSGPLVNTGRDLDVALTGDHWLAVQAPDGATAYTRAGDLKLTALGQITTAAGHPVLGEGGPIAVPPHDKLTLGSDGTVSVIPAGQGPETQVTVGRLQVVSAPPEQLARREDGLFGVVEGFAPAAAPGDVLITGALEGANVSLADTLVAMIENQRQYELHVKAMKTAEDNADRTASLLRLGS